MRPALQITRANAIEELSAALRAERKPHVQLRWRALLAIARGQHAPQVGKVLGVDPRSVRNWVTAYNRAGLTALHDRRSGRRCRLSAEQLATVKARLEAEPRDTDHVCSLRGVDIRRILREEFGTAYARSSVYYFLHETLGFSYLKPRPLHRKTDLAAQEAFKKTSRKSSRKSAKRTRTKRSKSGSKTKRVSGSRAR